MFIPYTLVCVCMRVDYLFFNLTIFLQFPSVYSKTRRRALEHTLDKFHNDKYPNVPYFLFGDFNFRTDTASVIKVSLQQ